MGLGSFLKKAVDPIGIFDKGGDTNITTDNSQDVYAPATISNSGVSDGALVDVLSQFADKQSKVLENAIKTSQAVSGNTNTGTISYKQIAIISGISIFMFLGYKWLKRKKYV